MSIEKEENCFLFDEENVVENENEEILEMFSCKYCEFQSASIDDLDEHIISHDEAFLEDKYEEEVGVGNIFERVNNNAPKFRINPFSFKNSKNISNDEQCIGQTAKSENQDLPAFYDEFKTQTEKRVFVCPYCGYQSMKKLDMHKHLKVHKEPVEVPVYACSECRYTSRHKYDLERHLLTHCRGENVTMYKCNHCPYETKRKGDLPRHMLCHKKPEEVHAYQCHQCTYSTRRRGDLKRHLLSHENDLPITKGSFLYKCSECGYNSKRLNDLHKHVVLHCDREVKGILKCKKCDYATKVANHFAKHVLSNCQIVDRGTAISSQNFSKHV